MKERPIIFSAPMVRALLSGEKTQTRRVVKLPHSNPLGQWETLLWGGQNGGRTKDGDTMPAQMAIGHSRTGDILLCSYGQPGDRLWVREAHYLTDNGDLEYVVYATDSEAVREHLTSIDRLPPDFPAEVKAQHRKLRPSIHMPRWASRITLEVTGVRVERLQDISESDCWAEGIEEVMHDFDDAAQIDMANRLGCCIEDAKPLYALLWERINGKGSWDANPWVWVIDFRRAAQEGGAA